MNNTTVEYQLGYVPSLAVTTAHSFPRIRKLAYDKYDTQLPNDFDTSSEYRESAAFIPLAIFLAGVFSLFVYHFLCCCCWCKWFRCVDYDEIADDAVDIELKLSQRIAWKRQTTIYFFYALSIGLILSNTFVFTYGDQYLTAGVEGVLEQFDFARNTSETLRSALLETIELGNNSAYVATVANYSQACPALEVVLGNLTLLSNMSATFADILAPVPDRLEQRLSHFSVRSLEQNLQLYYRIQTQQIDQNTCVLSDHSKRNQHWICRLPLVLLHQLLSSLMPLQVVQHLKQLPLRQTVQNKY